MAKLSLDCIFMILGYLVQMFAFREKALLGQYDPLVQDTYIHFLNVLIAVGYLTFVFSLWDFYMRARNARVCFAYCMVFIIGVIFLLSVIAGIGGTALVRNTPNLLRVRLENAVSIYGNDTVTSRAIDSVQRDMKCCGIYNDTDWMNLNLYYGANAQRGLPISCCEIPTSTFDHFTCNDTTLTLHKDGCLKAFGEYIVSRTNFIAYAGFITAAFQLFGLLWAMYYLCSPRDGYEEV